MFGYTLNHFLDLSMLHKVADAACVPSISPVDCFADIVQQSARFASATFTPVQKQSYLKSKPTSIL
jgi:hypothetical protein